MEEKAKISIIVPVYNVEKYVGKCIHSICAQTYQNLEILLVDDGSKDSSGVICDEWAAKDERICVFHVENGGQSKARNLGLAYASGNYIGFVDGDDVVTEEMYGTLLGLMEERQADIAECNFSGRKSREEDRMETGVSLTLSGREALIRHLDMRNRSRFPSTSVWSKLFRKEIIEGIRFPEGRIHEEYAFLCQTIYRCRTYAYLNEYLYVRTLRGDSTTAAAFSNRSLDKLEVYRERDAFLEKKGEEELLALSYAQRYDLMLHYYNQCMEHGMNREAVKIRNQLAVEKREVRKSLLPVKRKCLLLLLIYGKIIYHFLWKTGSGRQRRKKYV